ncbi:MAG: phage holin family protein [Candidatus Pacebacteria bacterium]|nr:phage holin family protein [Candidatus Paceibacterota bacterium]
MIRFIFQLIAGVASLWLADKFVSGVDFTGEIKYLISAGVVLGTINHFIKPLLKLITLPLRVLTFGLFGLIINIATVWAVDILFPELIIKGLIPLLLTTLIVWAVSFLLGLIPQNKS